jgi:hypothetical protein
MPERNEIERGAPSAQVLEYAKWLNSKSPAERQAAESRLEGLGAEAVEALVIAIQAEATKRRVRVRWGLAVLSLLVLVSLVSVVYGAHLSMFGAFGSIGSIFAISQSQRNAARALARYEDKRIVGPMTEALTYGDKDVAFQAKTALIRLLPTLQQSDAALLSVEQRRILAKRLTASDMALSLAILKAFEQVGGAEEIPAVERLMAETGRNALPLRVDPNVTGLYDAAKDCLLYLKERAESEAQRMTLLRGSSAPNVDAQAELLRPAAPGVSSDSPSELLRASDAGAEADLQQTKLEPQTGETIHIARG